MAERLRIVVDEIRTTIKQTFDDKVVGKAQIAYWVIIVANKMLGQHNQKRDSGAFVVPFAGIPVETAPDNSDPKIVKGRKFIRIPEAIFDFDRDKGIEFLAYYDPNETIPELHKKTIFRIKPAQIQWLNLNEFTSPSASDTYFYRMGPIVYIVGIENVPVEYVEAGLMLTISPLEKIDLDKEFFFPDELLSDLKRTVVDLARFSFLFPGDKTNDGDDDASNPQSKQIPKIASVNQNNE